jgi:hypothetical protein
MAILKNTTINDTGGFRVPRGTIAQRPVTPQAGMFRYNTDLNISEYYNGTAWIDFATGEQPYVKSGLIVDLDAGNGVSSPRDGRQWFDLSGSRNIATLENDATFRRDYLNLGDSADLNYATLPAIGINGLSTWTIDIWLMRTATNSIDSFISTGAGNNFLWYFGGSANTIIYENAPTSGSIPFSVTNGQIFNLVATGTGGASGSVTIFRNNVSQGTIASQNTTISVASQLGMVFGQELDTNNLQGGLDPNQKFRGRVYAFKFYNRVLTADERLFNFNAFRTRYGV